jgi:hypothetical protein
MAKTKEEVKKEYQQQLLKMDEYINSMVAANISTEYMDEETKSELGLTDTITVDVHIRFSKPIYDVCIPVSKLEFFLEDRDGKLIYGYVINPESENGAINLEFTFKIHGGYDVYAVTDMEREDVVSHFRNIKIDNVIGQ